MKKEPAMKDDSILEGVGNSPKYPHDPPPRFGSRRSRARSPLSPDVEPPKWGYFSALRDVQWRNSIPLEPPVGF
jgi:hypothetical protein